jgi:DNA-binding MurR/RpiR family transcriptional regulator
MAEAQSRGATVVALTGFPNSPIGAKADLVLLTHVEETTARHGSVAARYGQFFLADCLYTAVAQRTFPQSAEALTVTTKALARHRSARRTNRPTTPNPQAPPITGTDIVTK